LSKAFLLHESGNGWMAGWLAQRAGLYSSRELSEFHHKFASS
jgi:hypothetical protein